MRLVGALLGASLLASAGFAQEPRPQAAAIPSATDAPIAPVARQRSIGLPSGRLDYRAGWFETVLKDAKGNPQATISATSYVRTGAGDPAQRPVLVLFNGGPGASSSPLHFSAFGPRRLESKTVLVDNPATLLDAADLLFIDPVGTGFSRPLKDGGGDPYWSVQGDADAALTLIRAWLKANGRDASPLFVAGESYGGYRLGTMARAMQDLNVAGLVLISPALDFGTPADQAAIDSLPTMAVAAWYHKARQDGRTADQVWEAARRFAQSDYAVALQQGSALAPAERARVAAQIAELTGMSPQMVEQANLRIDSQRFLETLLPGHVVGRLDTRVFAPKPAQPLNANRPAAANDPALGLGKTNVILSVPARDYLRGEIGVPTARDYYSLTLDVNFRWNWARANARPGESWSVAGNLAGLMRARPKLRMLVLGGYYDLAVPLLETRYALTHSDVPLDRTTIIAMPAGHSVFEGDGNLAQASKLMHDFLLDRR